MQRHVRRHRYPKKRNIPRILLLLPLSAVLVFLLVGASIFLLGNAPKEPFTQAQRPDIIENLPQDAAYPQGLLPDSLAFDKLVLKKSERRLTAYANGKPVRVYLVALGENPVGHKQFDGDQRTPEGSYSISDKNPDSAYHRSLGISYPSDADRARAERLGKNPGGNIMIHGLPRDFASVGRFHRLTDWTFGSVAVTNEEIEELFQHTRVGTPIHILP